MTEPVWRKSGRCDTSSCVEVAREPDAVLVRDSKGGQNAPVLRFTPAEWDAFVGGVKDGDFDFAEVAMGDG